MKPVDFAYAAPQSLEEALELLKVHGDSAKILAGGQSLMPLLNMRLARPEVVIDINRIPGLGEITEADGKVTVGALVRHRDLETSSLIQEKVPLLALAAAQIGHLEIRNRGTAAGTVAHADPAAEIPAVLAALDGEILIQGSGGPRFVGWEDFFLTYLTTTLEPTEILTGLRFAVSPRGAGAAFAEESRRHGDFALVGAAAEIHLDASGRILTALLALTGVGGTPFRARSAEEILRGESPSPALFHRAADAVREGVEPDADTHASAEYRRHLAGVLAEEALVMALKRTGGGK